MIYRLKDQSISLWMMIAVILISILLPFFTFSNLASAAQLTSRSVTISTSKPSATATYTYAFTLPTTGNVGSISFQACTTPLGTCISPGGTINMNAGTVTQTGWSTNNFSRDTVGTGASGNCQSNSGSNTNFLCIKRTTAASETAGSRTVVAPSQVNPTANGSYFIRITTYSDTGWATAVDNGVVAYSITNQLTINARIQEVLNFCVGATAVDDATTSPGSDCSAISGSTVDIGVLDAALVNTSPVSSNGGSSTNGVAMVRTNAQSGVVISYFSEQNTSSGLLKVAGASCISNTSTTDQCINAPALSGVQAVINAGTEAFGFTIPGVNCGSVSSYTCTFSSGTYNLQRSSGYIGAAGNSYGVSNGYAWDSTGNPVTIATSAGSSVKAVDDEALILKYAATQSITTPQGSYTVTQTFVATATY